MSSTSEKPPGLATEGTEQSGPIPATDPEEPNRTFSRTPSKTEEQPPVDLVQLPEPEKKYLTGTKLFLVFLGSLLSVLVFALDQTIVATAQPRIVSRFNALDKIAWVSSTYFLTQAGLMLAIGQVLTITSTKLVYLFSLFVFELGSLLCAVAPSIEFLIFGRAVAGVGAAGLFTAILATIAEVTKLEDRPLLFGSFGGVFAVASAVGPILGGALTDHLSWRWCFYINLPFGGITMLCVVLFLQDGVEKPFKLRNWLLLDYLGALLSLAFVTTLVLALQWGGSTKPWNDRTVVACLVLSGVLLLLLLAWEYWLGDKAMLPFSILKRRTVIGAAFESFFLSAGLLMGAYYLPLWYQANGASASRSGINVLPFMVFIVVGAILSGAIINRTGRYWYFLVFGPLISSVGAGLLFTIHPDTPNSRIIGFQILLGVGMGCARQNAILATQAEYAREERLIPQATSVVNFVTIIGGVIGITAGASVFGNQLISSLKTLAPNLTLAQSLSVRFSVTAIFDLPKELQPGVIAAYSYSLNRVFLMGVPAGALASLCGLVVKNYNIQKRSTTHGRSTAAADTANAA